MFIANSNLTWTARKSWNDKHSAQSCIFQQHIIITFANNYSTLDRQVHTCTCLFDQLQGTSLHVSIQHSPWLQGDTAVILFAWLTQPSHSKSISVQRKRKEKKKRLTRLGPLTQTPPSPKHRLEGRAPPRPVHAHLNNIGHLMGAAFIVGVEVISLTDVVELYAS